MTVDIPTVALDRVQGRIARLGDPFDRNPHHAIFGTTGSGKSYLIRHGILPVYAFARTVVIDVKGGRDSAWHEWGQAVDSLPDSFGEGARTPADLRFRLIVDRAEGKSQVGRALDLIRGEGHCVLVLDESRSLTEREQLGLGSTVENLLLEGRSSGVTIIVGAQSTAWTASAVRDQPGAIWAGGMRSQEQSKKIAAIMGEGRELAAEVRSTPARSWLYVDAWDGDPFLARTRISSPSPELGQPSHQGGNSPGNGGP